MRLGAALDLHRIQVGRIVRDECSSIRVGRREHGVCFESEPLRRRMLDEYRYEIPHAGLPEPVVLLVNDTLYVVSLQSGKSRRQPINDQVGLIASTLSLSHTRIVRPLPVTRKRPRHCSILCPCPAVRFVWGSPVRHLPFGHTR